MTIEHFIKTEKVNNVSDIRSILNKKTEKGVNEFIISLDSKYPYIIMSLNKDKACLSYFRYADDPGFHSINNTVKSDENVITIFYTNTENEEIEVENCTIITVEQAVKAVEEFFLTEQLPKCIEWEEL